jgi:predicted AlkP superfamily phosphohydrolase/phosphomutase
MTTGKKPVDHGLFEYLYKDKENPGQMKLSSSKNVMGKRIWEIIEDQGLKSISCFVPLTWPLKPSGGLAISGIPTPKLEGVESTNPKGLKKEIDSALGTPLLIDITNFRELSKGEISEKVKGVSQLHLDTMKYLIREKEWQFFFGVISGSDRMNHIFWRYCDKTHRKYDPNSEFVNTLKDYYKYLDRELGKIIALLDKDTSIIILSDHGIMRMHSRVNLSDWLIREGYLVLKDNISLDSYKTLENSMVDLKKTKVFATGAYDGQIFINLKTRDGRGCVDVETYDSLVDELELKLKKIKGDDGKDLDTKIFKKKEYFVGDYEDIAPDIVVYFDDLQYGVNTSRVGNPTLWSPQTAQGSDDATHSKQGIFIMSDSVNKGYIGEIDILDVAPTILEKLKILHNLKGKIIR